MTGLRPRKPETRTGATPHCACCRRVHTVLDTRRSLRHRIGDSHPWSRLYDDIRTALEETT
jgi:hypothetical protein